MAAITVRRAAPADKEAVLTLWLALLDDQAALEERFGVAEDAAERWRNDYPEWLRDETRRLFVAERKGRVIGFLSAERWTPRPIYAATNEVYIHELYVREEARHRGAGRQLVDEVKAWAETLGAERLRLGVLMANENGRAFWKKIGAKPLSQTLTIALDQHPDGPASGKQNTIGF